MKRSAQMLNAGVPSANNPTKFKGFRKGPLKSSGPLFDFRHYSDLPPEEQDKTFRGMKSGHRFWH